MCKIPVSVLGLIMLVHVGQTSPDRHRPGAQLPNSRHSFKFSFRGPGSQRETVSFNFGDSHLSCFNQIGGGGGGRGSKQSVCLPVFPLGKQQIKEVLVLVFPHEQYARFN